jgi:ketosteroid isomerase-like protein
LLLLVLFYLPTLVLSQNIKLLYVEPEKEIKKVLTDQLIAWNKGDIEQYMFGYWKSDSLKFAGKSGIQYGWQKTLEGYKKSYPDKAAMGILTFTDIAVDVLSADAAFVIGKWALERDKGNISGIFTLLFKRINGQWVIVCDHSS